jgi:hypothetical protein
MENKQEWLKRQLQDVKALLKKWYEGKILWKDCPIYLISTREGNRAYVRETGQTPSFNMQDNGEVETHNGKHFIFLNDVLVNNYMKDEIQKTLVHEILHILHPNNSEQNIEEMTKTVCEHFNI